MIKTGVPKEAVKIKMGIDGLNPSLLDTPGAPSPCAAPSGAHSLRRSGATRRRSSDRRGDGVDAVGGGHGENLNSASVFSPWTMLAAGNSDPPRHPHLPPMPWACGICTFINAVSEAVVCILCKYSIHLHVFTLFTLP